MTDDVTLYLGDCLDVLPMLEPPYTACFCDPPYGLKFMGKEWDHGVPGAEVWRLVYDLLAPGAVLLAFGGTRTWHRLAVAIEDAGFEVFDTLMWLHGSGFPKSHDISKAIDKEAGAEREVVGPSKYFCAGRKSYQPDAAFANAGPAFAGNKGPITAPATPLAAAWSGYGTALKPAWEPIIAARKPREATYAQTAVEHGAGALWIDGGRIGTHKAVPASVSRKMPANCYGRFREYGESPGVGGHNPNLGRWPANLLLDEDSAAMLDEQSGTSKSTVSKACGRYKAERYADREAGYWGDRTPDNTYTDSGGASRFFYCAKASKSERDAGLDEIEPRTIGHNLSTNACARCGKRVKANGSGDKCECGDLRETIKVPTASRNHHPTVKPLAVCEYLARLILPPEGYRDAARLLVPFAGSGSEMVGALQAGWRNVTGIECEPEYVEIAERRLEHWRAQLPLPLAEGAG